MERKGEKMLLGNLMKTKVYAFVGPSGTGKSYRAQMVAGEYDIHYIIDDGNNNMTIVLISVRLRCLLCVGILTSYKGSRYI